ncbi:hypothetical protein Dolphis_108 [Pseudomonas phage Dolphis]|nr:hypothetical protein Dolphis_108 [Pseudomonas phage Dolphis]
MADRELLELAAKAAGQIQFDPFRGVFRHLIEMGFLGEDWNPLNDDGDALRLAVKLNLSIITSWGFDGKPSGSVGAMLGSHEDLRLTNTDHGDDPCAAWRRAIVLAAAEMGKAIDRGHTFDHQRGTS